MKGRPLVAALLVPASVCAEVAPARVPAAGASLGSVVLSLALVLALIFALGWALRRLQFARSGGDRLLGVLAQLPLGPRDRIVLLRVGDRQALVGVSPAGIRPLQLLEREIAVPAEAATAAPEFASRLRELIDKGRGA